MPGKSFWFDAWWPVVVIAGLAFVIFLLGVILLLWAHSAPRGRRRRSLAPAVFGILSLTGLAVALTGGVLLFQFGSYRKLNEWEVVARISCSARGRIGDYDIEYISLAAGKVHNSRRYGAFGDRWSLGADVIEWAGPLRPLGLHRSIKITQIEGVYDRAQDYLERPVTRLGSGSDRFALKVRQANRPPWPYCYLVRSAYTTSVSQEPVPGELFDVIGTRDGLALRPAAF
jgi:hypothetical protein